MCYQIHFSVCIVPHYTLIILVKAVTKITETLVKDCLLQPRFMPNILQSWRKWFLQCF